MINKKTKVVCTLGPACEKAAVLTKMVQAGMNVARLNFSHGNYSQFEELIKTVRSVAQKLQTPVAIMQDLQGPKIRVGEMPENGVILKNGSVIVLTIKDIKGTDKLIPIQYKELYKDVKKNDRILLNDGMMEIHVIKIQNKEITCKVVIGGKLLSHKGINVPTASISAHPITPKDKKDLVFGLKQNVDFVAMSFVKNAQNIRDLRSMIRQHAGEAKIIAKIERHEAVENLEEIILEADGVMVARGDLGVEIPPEQVPIIQKKIIHMANKHGKPVITATEMLQSMIENPRATRAEVSDVANAILDHTDAIMLSNESAVGKFPVQAVLTLSKVAVATENEIQKHQVFLQQKVNSKDQPLSYATCEAAARLAEEMKAKLIVAVTLSGFTAEHIAKHRVFIPLYVLTENPKVEKQMQLVWGATQTFVEPIDFSNHLEQVKKLLLKNRVAKHGDKVVVVSNASKDEKLISTIIL
jgi:pyruvate kinase